MLGHGIVSHTDTYCTGAQLNSMIDGSIITLHSHPQVTTHESTYNHANYDTAYSWGNHATVGYLTAATSGDHTVASHLDTIVTGAQLNLLQSQRNKDYMYSWAQTTNGVYQLTHQAGTKTPHVTLYNENFEIIEPDYVKGISTTVVEISTQSYGSFLGWYNVRVG
jgi:hypothetical protein